MFQKKVNTYLEIPNGFEGQLADTYIGSKVTCFPLYDTANQVTPGSFVIGEVDNNTKDFKYAKLAKGNIKDKPILGVVLRNSEKNPGIKPSNKINNGSHIMVLGRGAVYIKAPSDAQAGYFVFLKDDDGSVVFDKTTTKTSHSFTGFVVTSGGKKDSMIIITA